ncbi:hypothetical protein HED52_10235 [Ochrobactrum ciceri]|uniref:Uncharacterized protein n=1 Tax=Brucella ciceri TaxID=391287 RepID=A0ABX1E030_9HYPH|nr:hypothetical protein [Brucella ciceri]
MHIVGRTGSFRGSQDQGEYPELEGAVRYFDEGSVDSMMSAAAQMLDDVDYLKQAVQQAVSTSSKRFEFMLDRFLVVLGQFLLMLF